MQYQNAKYETTMSYATRGMNGMIFLAGVWEFLEAWIPTYLVAEILDFLKCISNLGKDED